MPAPKRPNYFQSQFLVVRDFQDEQAYHEEMLRRHNRLLHDWGVVRNGLQVTKAGADFKIEVGSAIDSLGREIVLEKAATLSAGDVTAAQGTGPDVSITIAFNEVNSDVPDDNYPPPGGKENVTRKMQEPIIAATKSPAEPAVVLARVKSDNTPDNSVRRLAGSFVRGSGSSDLCISTDGKVGIGTNSPNFPLQVGSTDVNGSWKLCVAGKGSTGNWRQWTLRTGDGDNEMDIHKFRIRDEQGAADRLVIDQKGNIGMGTTGPAARLHVEGSGNGMPATTGTAQSAGHVARLKDSSNLILDIGGAVEKGFWLQSTDAANLATNYPLLLNPNGGNVGIGTTAPKQKLEIRDGDGLIQMGRTAPTLVKGSDNGGAIYFGVDRTGGIDQPTAAIETSWGGGDSNPQIGIGVTREFSGRPGANLLMDFSGNANIRQGLTSRLFVQGGSGNVGIGTTDPGTSKLKIANSATDFGHVRFASAGGGELEIVCWTGGWNINNKTGGKNLYLNRDANAASDLLLGRFQNELIVKGDNGNVGIGNTSPEHRLQIGGNVNGIGFQPSDGSPNAGYVRFGDNTGWKLHFGRARSGGTVLAGLDGVIMTLLDQGKVGIGTTAPLGPLSIGDSSVDGSDGFIVIGKRAGGGTRHYRIGFDSNFRFTIGDYGNSNTASTWTSPFSIAWNAPSNALFIRDNGWVGVGTGDPRVPLEVSGWRSIGLNNSPDGFGNNTGFNGGGVLGTAGGGNFNVSILSNGWICGDGIVANSDRRIKEIVGPSDTGRDLEIIQQLRVTEYRHLDKMAEGNSLRKGFIGQEVLEILPQAVGSRRNVIPDIYSEPTDFAFDQNQKTLSVTLHKAHELTESEVVQILTEDGAKTVTVMAVPTTNSFIVGEFEKEPRRVFVYGREVDDFLAVHYDQIFTTAVGAIQELKKEKDGEVKALRAGIAELQAANDELTKKLRLLVGNLEIVPNVFAAKQKA